MKTAVVVIVQLIFV